MPLNIVAHVQPVVYTGRVETLVCVFVCVSLTLYRRAELTVSVALRVYLCLLALWLECVGI